MDRFLVVKLHKAQRTCAADPVCSLSVAASEPFPEGADLEQARAAFAEEAAHLADALFETLPGGTLDALMVELMRRKVSLFVVSHGAHGQREQFTALEALEALREHVEVDGYRGSKCWDARRFFDARTRALQLLGIPDPEAALLRECAAQPTEEPRAARKTKE